MGSYLALILSVVLQRRVADPEIVHAVSSVAYHRIPGKAGYLSLEACNKQDSMVSTEEENKTKKLNMYFDIKLGKSKMYIVLCPKLNDAHLSFAQRKTNKK